MTNDGKPTGRGQLRRPVSVACCRWTPINLAEIKAGNAAATPDPDPEQAGPSDTSAAGNAKYPLKTP